MREVTIGAKESGQRFSKFLEWKTVKTWKKTKNASNLLFADSYKLSAKGTYRCKCTAVFTKSGKKETITKTTGKKQYK